MATGNEKHPLNVEEILPQMMEELIQLKAEKNALVSLIGFLLKKIQLPQEEQEHFFRAYTELSTEEFTRLKAAYPWFEQYLQDKNRNHSGENGREE